MAMSDKEKIENALIPAVQFPTDADFESLFAGVGPNKEYTYSAASGFTKNQQTNAPERNVFSTFALQKGGIITSEELIRDRIENADRWEQETQRLAGVISPKFRHYYNKNSWLGAVWSFFPRLTQGLQDFGVEAKRMYDTVPQTMDVFSTGGDLQEFVNELTDEEFEHVKYAIGNAYYKIRDPKNYPNGVGPSLENTYAEFAMHNPDDMVADKDGSKLTDKEKAAIETFQSHLKAKEQASRNEMAKAFYQTYNESEFAFEHPEVGMGGTTVAAVGHFAADAFATMALFEAVGFTPVLWGKTSATTVGRLARMKLTAQGIKNFRLAQENIGRVLKVRKAYPKFARKAYKSLKLKEQVARSQIGLGIFITRNLPKILAFSGMAAGSSSIFGASFLMQANDMATELIAKGADWDTALGASIVSGFIEGGIEVYGGFRFLNKFLSENRSFRNFLFKAIIPEGGEEFLQSLSAHAVKKAVGMDEAQYSDIAAEALYAFIGGALGGAFMGAYNYKDIASSHRERVLAAAMYEREVKENGPKRINSALAAYGVGKREIRQRFLEESKAEREAFNKRLKAQREEFDKVFGTPGNSKYIANKTERDMEFEDIIETQREELRRNEAARQQKMQEELKALQAKHEQALNQSLDEDFKDISKVAFTANEEKILEMLRATYDEQARKANPDITLEQLEAGWKGVREAILHEGYTGEFTQKVSNTIDNMISFANSSDKMVQQGLNKLTEQLTLTGEDNYMADVAKRLTSKDAIEKYNAKLDAMEHGIVEQFKLAGAETEGKLFARIFRNKMGTLPLFALDENGDPVDPLSFYNAVKPHIINIQSAMMYNKRIDNVDSIMMETFDNASDSDENYRSSNGSYQFKKAYDRYSRLWDLICAYDSLPSKEAKNQALTEINLTLFNSYNYTNDIETVRNYIENRARKEMALISDMGLLHGSQCSDEDFRILALMRQKNLSFSFAARAIGLVSSFARKGPKSFDGLNTRYIDALSERYAPLTEEDKNWLARTSENLVLGDNVVNRPQELEEKTGTAMYGEGETPSDERVVTPNAMYTREDKTIFVNQTQGQGEIFHEAGHYLMTEFLVDNTRMAVFVGDKAFGPINQLTIDLYEHLKGSKNVRIYAAQKQETLLDAIMDFIRTGGNTGDKVTDEILNEMRHILNETIMHPVGSKYEALPDKQKAALKESIRNLFKPTTSLEMLNARVDLEKAINNKPIEAAVSMGLSLMDKYLVPDMDMVRYVLESPTADYFAKRTALQQLMTEINLQGIALMLNNTEKMEDMAFNASHASTDAEDIRENHIFFFKPKQSVQERRTAPKKAREGLNAYERGQEIGQWFLKGVKDPRAQVFKPLMRYTEPFTMSLVETASRVDPDLGPAIQHVMFEHGQRIQEAQVPAKAFIDVLKKQNETDNPIMQDEYEVNFVDALNNMRNAEARKWIVNRVNPELSEQIGTAFDGMLKILNQLKAAMETLEVKPEIAWIADNEFFPRSIKDYNKFREEFLNLAAKSVYQSLESKKNELVKNMEPNKRTVTEIRNKLQRAFADLVRNGSAEHRVGFLQRRVIYEVTPEMRKYYKDPIDAYMDYVKDAATTIMTRQLIGAQHEIITGLDENASVSSLLQAGVIFRILNEQGLLAPESIDITGASDEEKQAINDQNENLKQFDKALRAFINRHKEQNGLYKFTNDFLTVTMLAHASTALSQGQEMITTSWLFGLKNTYNAVKDAIKGKNKITIEDLGIEELEDAYKAVSTGTMEMVTNASLKYSGFKMADVFFKNVALNAIYNYFNEAMKDPNSDMFKEAQRRIEGSFAGLDGYKERVAQLMKDIKNKKLSEDVKYLIYDTFAHQQPINSANISYGYNAASPIGRLCLYKFNTVAYRQLSAICSKLKNSWSYTDEKGKLHIDPKKGLLSTLTFLLFCGLIGIPLDVAKNLLSGRLEFHPQKSWIFSVGQCFLINEFEASTITKEGIGSLLKNKFAPPLTALNWVSQDAYQAFKMLKGDDDANFLFKTVKGMPIFGRPINGLIYSLSTMANDSPGYSFDDLEGDIASLF